MKKIILLLMCLMPVATLTAQAESVSWLDKVKDESVQWTENKQITTKGFYKIDIKKESSYQFVLGDPEKGLANLAITDDNGNHVAAFSTNKADGNAKETAMNIKLRKGTYYIHVYNDVVKAVFKQINDAFVDLEPNNIEEQALPFPFNTPVYGRNNGMPADTDYYTFTLQKPQMVTFTMEPWPFPNRGSYRIRLNWLIGLNNQSVTSSSVYLPVGTYTFTVETSNYNPNSSYTFRVDTAPVPKGLIESVTGTTNLKKGQTVNGIVSAEGYFSHPVDYYTIDHVNERPFTLLTTSTRPVEITVKKLDEEEQGFKISFSHNGRMKWSDTLEDGKYQIGITMNAQEKKDIPYTIYYDTARFFDVPSTYIYIKEIERLADLKIINGYEDGTFKPQQSILRKHVFAMISRSEGFTLEAIRPMKPFNDLSEKDGYYEIIKQFYEAGVIDGNGNSMNPEKNLTRSQLAKILVNTYDLEMKGAERIFNDVSPANESYPYIQILASHGITTGSNGSFMPSQPVTRQHFALFLSRTMDALKE